MARTPLFSSMFDLTASARPEFSPKLSGSGVLKLHSTGAQYQRSHFTEDGSQYDDIFVGAAIFRRDPLSCPSLLSNLPKLFFVGESTPESASLSKLNMPSGKVSTQDESIACALARMVKERTGTKVVRIVGSLPDSTFCTDVSITPRRGRATTIQRTVRQLNFVVEAESGQLYLDQEGQTDAVWVTEKEASNLDTLQEVRAVIRDAFGWAAREHRLNNLELERPYQAML